MLIGVPPSISIIPSSETLKYFLYSAMKDPLLALNLCIESIRTFFYHYMADYLVY